MLVAWHLKGEVPAASNTKTESITAKDHIVGLAEQTQGPTGVPEVGKARL